MTRAEHYLRAEQLIQPGQPDEEVPDIEMVRLDVAVALVHATLACADAAVEGAAHIIAARG